MFEILNLPKKNSIQIVIFQIKKFLGYYYCQIKFLAL